MHNEALSRRIRKEIEKCKERWYPLIEHPVQVELVNDPHRFKVVPAGRRSGKTERLKRYVARAAMEGPEGPYFLCAPTYKQVKKIFWEDMKQLTFSPLHARPPSASELIIYMPGGQTVHLIGLDEPSRFEGIPWVGGGIDEIADVKEEAWFLNIKPALDTFNPTRPEHKAWCWLIGVPEGRNHYYELAEYAKSGEDPDWKFYTWLSSDILPVETIEAARRTMSTRQFRQEYEASFESALGSVYEDYSSDNYTNRGICPTEPIMWMHDFNYSPLSSAIGQRIKDNLYIIDEIVLHSSTARQSAIEFVNRYKDHPCKTVVIYGDPSGRVGEKHGQISNYKEMEDILRDNNWQLTRKVRKKAPAIKDRQNAVRAKIKNANGQVSLFVNKEKAKYTHKGLATTQLKEGSAFLEEETEFQHITTALGYCIDYEWPIYPITTAKLNMEPAAHAWR